MQEKREFNFSKEHLDFLNQDASYLYTFFSSHFSEIHDMLFVYHYDNRERVYDEEIIKESISYLSFKGSFIVNYHIGFFNACADLDYHTNKSMKFTFVIKDETLILKGEHWLERFQDEI